MLLPEEYCFGCDMAIAHCRCHLAGLGEDDEPREANHIATIARLTADLAARLGVQSDYERKLAKLKEDFPNGI